jgi:hypothetical protein
MLDNTYESNLFLYEPVFYMIYCSSIDVVYSTYDRVVEYLKVEPFVQQSQKGMQGWSDVGLVRFRLARAERLAEFQRVMPSSPMRMMRLAEADGGLDER